MTESPASPEQRERELDLALAALTAPARPHAFVIPIVRELPLLPPDRTCGARPVSAGELAPH
jgi:hypothetical protein